MALHIIAAMEALNYFPDEEGMCNGVALMAIQAALRGDLPTFNKRMDFIHSYQDAGSLLKDLQLAESIRLKQHTLSKSLFSFLKSPDYTAAESALSKDAAKMAMLFSIKPFLMA